MLFSNLRVILSSDLIFRLQLSWGPKVSHNLPIDTVGVRLWKRKSETVCWSAEVHSAVFKKKPMYPLWSSVFAVIASICTCVSVYVTETGSSWYGCSLRNGHPQSLDSMPVWKRPVEAIMPGSELQ